MISLRFILKRERMIMNEDMIKRILEAKKYQKMAFYALFPESITKHLKVIEDEINVMAKEIILNSLCENKESKNGKHETSKVKKVDID